jgi:glycosyltransferase involved in cell wall biosynthesis
MRILILHSRYRSGSLSGENRVVDEEAGLLRQGGHHVQVLSPSPDDFSRPELATRSLTSRGVAGLVHDRVRSERIEIVHCHNLFPALGPAVLTAASDAGAAVVATLHNYRLLCMAGTLFRNGRVCQDCLGRSPLAGLVHACYRGSHPESAIMTATFLAARARRTFDSVDRFLAVSAFVRAKHIEAGFSPERILVKPNVVGPQEQRVGAGRYFLILSRLSAEKGIADIVASWDKDVGDLVIAGDGPEFERVKELAAGRGVVLRGAVAPSEIPELLSQARAILVPSSWYEGQPRVMLEAYASGVPVIGSRIGGVSELIEEGETGLTVPLDDASAWRRAAAELADDSISTRLGQGAYARWVDRFSPLRGLTALEAAYLAALDQRARRSSRRTS